MPIRKALIFVIALSFVALVGLRPDAALARYASIVIDYGNGRILYEKNADTRNYPASLTKIMTLYMTFEALDKGKITLHEKLKVSKRAAGMPASRLGLKRGETITVENAILALVTKSANDVAVVLAEKLGGSEKGFAKLMTAKANAIGMTKTSFRNASGLPNRGQLSTARDMSTLAIRMLNDYPHYYHYFATKNFSFKSRTYRNHNKLLRSYRGTDGIKTGYIRASGFNLVASTVRDGRRLIAVVFGGKTGKSRDRHMRTLLNKGFARAAQPLPPPLLDPPPRKPLNWMVAYQAQPVRDTSKVVDASKTALAAPPPKPAPKAELVADPAIPAPKPTLSGQWGIQVGAYYKRDPAEQAASRAAERLPDLLSSAQITTPKINGNRGTIYRARLVGLSEGNARKACQRLKAEQIDCLVVQVPRSLNVAYKSTPNG